jgi:hypothetical protein
MASASRVKQWSLKLLQLAHYKSRKRNESQDDTEAISGET